MRTDRSKSPRNDGPIRPAQSLPLVQTHAAGIDLGNAEHFVCVPADSVPPGENPVRRFGVFNPDLDRMIQWLKQCQVKTVALESTGVMWIPVWKKLEAAGLEAVLVNTKGVKHVPGRKSDVLDCQWLQQLHSYGLLSGSFRPADLVCQMRTLLRQRGRESQHMQKALQEMGVHLHVVVSDVCGDTGLRIIDALLAGQREPAFLVTLRDPRIRRSTPAQMEAALQGNWREELLFVLGQSRQSYEFFQGQIGRLDERILLLLAQMPEAPAVVRPSGEAAAAAVPALAEKKRPKKMGTGGNPLPQDIRPQLAQIMGVDLTLIPGLNALGALIILSEIGPDLKRWRDAKAFAAWLGLAPGSKISGGKVLSSRTPHVMNRVAVLLRLAALVVGRTETAPGSFYRRIRARHGAPKAMTATARKLAELIYNLMTRGTPYVAADPKIYEERVRQQKVLRLAREAKKLGYDLVQWQASHADTTPPKAASC